MGLEHEQTPQFLNELRVDEQQEEERCVNGRCRHISRTCVMQPIHILCIYPYVSSQFSNISCSKVQKKQSYPYNRSWRPHRVVGRRNFHIFQTIASQMAVRLSSLRAGCPLPPERFLVLVSIRDSAGPRAAMWLELLGRLKNAIILSGIEPSTFRLVA
jgi:hypothetical protein